MRSQEGIASHHRVAIFIVVGALTGIAPLSIDAYIPNLPELTSDLGTSASTGQLPCCGRIGPLLISELFCDGAPLEPVLEPSS